MKLRFGVAGMTLIAFTLVTWGLGCRRGEKLEAVKDATTEPGEGRPQLSGEATIPEEAAPVPSNDDALTSAPIQYDWINWGLMTAQEHHFRQAPGAVGGLMTTLSHSWIVHPTTEVPYEWNDWFGIKYCVWGAEKDEGTTITLDIVIRHPEATHPITTRTSSTTTWSQPTLLGGFGGTAGWRIRRPWYRNPGEHVFEVWHDGEKRLEKRFFVRGPMQSALQKALVKRRMNFRPPGRDILAPGANSPLRFRIRNAGLFTTANFEERVVSAAIYEIGPPPEGLSFVADTTAVPRDYLGWFGIEYHAGGLAPNESLKVTTRIRHPEVTDPRTGMASRSVEEEQVLRGEESRLLTWKLGLPHERVEGDYLFEVLYSDTLLLREVITVYEPVGGDETEFASEAAGT